MRGATADPSPEDFGLTTEQISRARLPFVSLHRAGLFAVLYLSVTAVAFTSLWRFTGSITAAAFFSVMIVAAGSILLIPLLLCVLCVAEEAQRRRLCQQMPEVAACVAFRDVVEASRARRRPPVTILPATRWNRLSKPERRRQLLARLEGCGVETSSSTDSDLSGWDVVAVGNGHHVVIRCWSGSGEVPAAVAREMVACLADHLGSQAWVVATSEASSGFRAAVGARPISVVHPDAVHGLLLAT